GNPEFDEWALLDREGKPVVFAPNWPTRFQTLHSPFRQRSVAQVRELLSNYGRVDGLWLDIFHERLNTSSEWTAKAYEKMFGEPFDKAAGPRLAEFNARTLAGYLEEVQAIARERGQTSCLWTANGSGGRFLQSDIWTQWVGSRLDYGSLEAHSFARNDEAARMAWAMPKPLEIGFILNSTWFTPLEDKPPPARPTDAQAIAGAAIALCQGANVYLALTPGHAGEFGEDLQRAKAIGAWYRQTQSWLENAQPYADVGILLGATASASALSDALAREGVFSRWLRAPMRHPAILLPAQTRLDEAQAGPLRQYVQDGGQLIAFGQTALLDDLLGVRFKGNLAFPVKLRGASVKVDSEYSAEYPARHLLDGQPTFWASGGAPMPHWAEITLPEPVEVQTVELVSREGPYLVTDVDIEVPEGKDWRVAKSVRAAKSRTIIAKLAPPAKTDRVRVKILRELFQGQERQYADVESIRVLDRAGRDWASALPEPVRVLGAAADFTRWFGDSLALPPWAVAVEPTTAEVLGRFDHPGP
ncbi:MAG: discoidin domain-containing protein, partial [Planctomycetes bacterium]|nr:discoidin domain-containing protein [Planctomycetota bacterium]